MTPFVRFSLTTVPLVLFALMAGFFYAFSVCVMPGLDRIDTASAIKAMQGINLAVRNPVFFVTYFFAPVVAALLGIGLWMTGFAQAGRWLLGAGTLYAVGVLLPTGAINVPMNDALAVVTDVLATTAGKTIWTEYSVRWSLWNAVRSGVATTAIFMTVMALAHL